MPLLAALQIDRAGLAFVAVPGAAGDAGPYAPVASNGTDAGRTQNRRVESVKQQFSAAAAHALEVTGST